MTMLPNLSEHANRGTLAADERARLRARLERAMDERPALVASPYFPRIAFGPFAFPARMAYGLAALLLVVAVSGSTAYAAESAVPGDLLYGVKTGVNEPVALAFSVSAQSKAQTHAAIAEERLAEAEALASRGTLTATTSVQLADSFAANAADASDLIASIAPRDPAAASALRATFSQAVAAHASTLLARGDAATDTVRIASGNLVRNAIAATIGGAVRPAASDARGSALAIAEAPVEEPAAASTEEPVSSGTIAIALSAAAPNEAAPAEAPHAFSVMMKAASTAEPAPPPAARFAPQTAVNMFSVTASIQQDLSALIDAASTSLGAASSTLGAEEAARAADALSDAKLIGLQVQADVAAGDDAAAQEDRARGFAAVAKVHALLMQRNRGFDGAR